MDVLKIAPNCWEEQTVEFSGNPIKCRVYKDLCYVSNPTDGIHHHMTIYIPESALCDKERPVILKNHVGLIGPKELPKGPIKPKPVMKSSQRLDDICREMLAHGYIVVCPNTRNLEEAVETKSCGYAPRVVVDLKAAVRFLRHNADVLPGNMEKIISSGGSGGGAVSALLGVSGNHEGYAPYLAELGVADERDDIFGDICYCPIIDVNRADIAFEWMFGGEVVDYTRARELPAEKDKVLSAALAAMYNEQVNALGLRHPVDGTQLTLTASGHEGPYLDYFLSLMDNAAEEYLDTLTETARQEYLAQRSWLPYDEQTGKVHFTWAAFTEYLKVTKRTKNCPAFDHLNLRGKENQLFGTEIEPRKHFSCDVATVALGEDAFAVAQDVSERAWLMETMNFTSGNGCTPAKNFYIRVGATDTGISYTQSMNMAVALFNSGKCDNISYKYTWEAGHVAYYDMEELFAWIDDISKAM